jgi:parallel beta-helix repeat protein
MKHPNFTPPALTLLLAILTPALLYGQGSLTPPGPPAPTMKTLDQIEPRTQVNATNTPGDSDSLFKITQPGSYYLARNISGVAGKHGIEVNANGVTLDLNGFEIRGVAGSLVGVRAVITENLSVRNGAIRDWGGSGVEASVGQYSTFENLRCGDNGVTGMRVNAGSVLRGCVANENTTDGFICVSLSGNANSRVTVLENCSASGNGGHGFNLVSSASLQNCTAEFSGGDGISATVFYSVTAINCTVVSNTGNGISLSGSSTLTNCTARENTGSSGIFAGDGSTLTNCTAKDNTGTYGIRAGVGSTLANCTASDNDVEYGIHADDRSTLSNCTGSLNTSGAVDSYGISAGAQCTVSQCTASGNLNSNGTPVGSTGGGIVAGNGSTVHNCTATGNKGDGIRVFNDARVVGNSCDSNGFPAGTGDGAGIHASSSDNRIEGNNVTDNTRGIDVDSTGNLIIKNSAAGNSSNYEIAANNIYGSIVDRVGVLTIAVSGNSAGSSAGTTDPWANFSY